MDAIENIVRKLVCEALEQTDISDVANSDDLKELGMDSLNCIALIVSIESHFNIEISDQQLGIEFVSSIDDICALIKDYLEVQNEEIKNERN